MEGAAEVCDELNEVGGVVGAGAVEAGDEFAEVTGVKSKERKEGEGVVFKRERREEEGILVIFENMGGFSKIRGCNRISQNRERKRGTEKEKWGKKREME